MGKGNYIPCGSGCPDLNLLCSQEAGLEPLSLLYLSPKLQNYTMYL